jgi:hypothetical protein
VKAVDGFGVDVPRDRIRKLAQSVPIHDGGQRGMLDRFRERFFGGAAISTQRSPDRCAEHAPVSQGDVSFFAGLDFFHLRHALSPPWGTIFSMNGPPLYRRARLWALER